jgi:hypothetical protein
MSKAIEAKLAQLEKQVEADQLALQKKISAAVITYGVLALIVVGTTTFLVAEWKAHTSPEAVAGHVKSFIDGSVSDARKALIDELEKNSEQTAKKAVRWALDQIPKAEAPISEMLDSVSEQVTGKLNEELVPAFAAALKEQTPELRSQYKELTDDDAMLGLAKVMVDVVETEMDKYLNDEFGASVGDLQSRLRQLGKPRDDLTKREDAERRALVYFSYLAERGEFGSSVFDEFLERMKDDFRFLGSLTGSGSADEEDVPVRMELEEVGK